MHFLKHGSVIRRVSGLTPVGRCFKKTLLNTQSADVTMRPRVTSGIVLMLYRANVCSDCSPCHDVTDLVSS